MGTLFHHRAVLNNHNAIGIHHRRKPVGDYQRGMPARQGSERIRTACSEWLSRLVASSNTRMGASLSTALAIDTRWRSPRRA